MLINNTHLFNCTTRNPPIKNVQCNWSVWCCKLHHVLCKFECQNRLICPLVLLHRVSSLINLAVLWNLELWATPTLVSVLTWYFTRSPHANRTFNYPQGSLTVVEVDNNLSYIVYTLNKDNREITNCNDKQILFVSC